MGRCINSASTNHGNIATNKIDPEKFYHDYCLVQTENSDFYLGYYVHLLCDIYWAELIWKNKKVQFEEELKKDPKFVWKMKKDWYDLDRKFIRDSRLTIYENFKNIQDFPNSYFDFYPSDAFSRQIKYITDFYSQFPDDLDREYGYLTENEIDSYIREASRRIIEILKNKRVSTSEHRSQ